jgi:hypothetical protein
MALRAREERRRRRSDDTLTALTLWLEGARRRGELDCLALCDETGFLIAGAGVHRQCEELAALGAVRAADPGTDADVRVAPVDLRGVRALICADAEARRESAHMLSAIAAGCRRILLQPRFTAA